MIIIVQISLELIQASVLEEYAVIIQYVAILSNHIEESVLESNARKIRSAKVLIAQVVNVLIDNARKMMKETVRNALLVVVKMILIAFNGINSNGACKVIVIITLRSASKLK